MTRGDQLRFADVLDAIDAIQAHLERGSLGDGLVYDAVRMRLVEIGEAVKGLGVESVQAEPSIDWSAVARMRDRLAHRYFDTDHAIVQDVVDNELDPLAAAIRRLAGEPPAST